MNGRALMSFDMFTYWDPRQTTGATEQAYVENIIAAASLRLADIIGRSILRKEYTEICSISPTIRLKNDWVKEISTVSYDMYRTWDGETNEDLVEGTDWFWDGEAREFDLLYSHLFLYRHKVLKVTYTAGLYPITYCASTAPTGASEGEVWKDTTNLVYKYYDGESWEVIDDDLVIDSLLQNALVELVIFNRNRLAQGGVGSRSIQGNSVSSFYQQVEVEVPDNVLDMIQGYRSLV